MSALIKYNPCELDDVCSVSQPVIEHPLSTLARHDTQGTLDLLRHMTDQQSSVERYRISAKVEKTRILADRDMQIARINAHRDVLVAKEITMQTRVNAYSSIVQTAINHSIPRPLSRVQITEDRGGWFSSRVFRLTVELD